MLKINKQTITLTKGDDASLRLVPRYKDRTEYVLTEGDRAVFRIKFGHTLVELECTLNLETNKIVANITPNDTKDFNPGIYRYEAELITSFGFHYTFIADQTFILGQEYEQRITSTSNGNSSAVGGNLPEIDGIVDGEPVVYGDIQPTNPMMDYDELNHLPKLNDITIKGSHDNAYYGIPTKTSDLENDSDFVSDDDYVHTDNNYDDTAKNAVDALGTASTYDVPESGNASTSQVVKGDDSRLRDNRDPNPHTHSKADITDFPTNVSAFNNDSGFITNTVNNLANYYLKTETYTRAEVEQLIAAIKQGKFEIVAELPASGDANVIYLVPKSTAQTSNSYDEYVYINNAWEKIGDTDIDLSGYVTDDELTTALQSYLTTSAFNTAIASYYTKTETDNLLANKVDKVAGKGLSTNDYDNTAKGIVDGVTSALNDKVDKVQGKGLSTNDYDNTAKGIVDGVTSALADKVDKVNGKGLSTEDYTTAEKSKLGGISDNAKKVASSSTNGHIEIDDVDTAVYDDTAVQTAIDNIEDELSTDYATVEGNPINFSTLSAQKSKSTILSCVPIQDLHGYDKPWVGGAGKNKYPILVGTDYWFNNSGASHTNNNGELVITTIGDNSGVFSNSNTMATTYLNMTNPIASADIKASTPMNVRLGENYNVPITTTYQRIQFVLSSSGLMAIYGRGTAGDIYIKNVQLESGSTATSYEPYENICPISGRNEIGILGCGKNLVDQTRIYPDGSAYNVNIWWCRFEIPNGVYTASTNIPKTTDIAASCFVTLGENPSTANNYISNEHSKTITVTDGFVYIAVRNGKSQETDTIVTQTDLTNGTYWIQLEKGEQPTDYEPYTKSNDLTISLGQTVYGGTLDVENGVLVVDRIHKNLGDLSWGKNPKKQFYTTDINDFKYEGTGSIKQATYFICSNYSALDDNISLFINDDYSSEPKNRLFITDDAKADMTTSEFKTAMDGVDFVYELATPTTISLTPEQVKLLQGVNNISTDGDSITLTYRDGKVATLGDLTSAVDNLDSKIDESKILTDTATGDKYILVVTNGVLSVEQISN